VDKHGRRNGYSDTVAFFLEIEGGCGTICGGFDIVMVRDGEGCPTLIEDVPFGNLTALPRSSLEQLMAALRPPRLTHPIPARKREGRIPSRSPGSEAPSHLYSVFVRPLRAGISKRGPVTAPARSLSPVAYRSILSSAAKSVE
jgi:hypothetical protein